MQLRYNDKDSKDKDYTMDKEFWPSPEKQLNSIKGNSAKTSRKPSTALADPGLGLSSSIR